MPKTLPKQAPTAIKLMTRANSERITLLSAQAIICEDEVALSSALQLYLDGEALTFKSLKDFMESPLRSKVSPKLFILDLCNPDDPEGMGTLELLPELQRLFPRSDRIILSGVSDIEMMKATLKAGATRYLSKELVANELPLILACLKDKINESEELNSKLIGSSEKISTFKAELLRSKLETINDILIEGESGVGKEICARFFAWPNKNFIAINAAAIPSELFESEFFGADKGAFTSANQNRMGVLETAQNGLLFIDEIQSLILPHQAKLLRFLETREYSRVGSTQIRNFKGRIIAATNANLKDFSSKGLFREDLYFRLSSLRLSIPPLRNRREDIEELAIHFLQKSLKKRTIQNTLSPDALSYLTHSYDWPGNVRELSGVIEKAIVNSRMPIIDSEEIQKALGSNTHENENFSLDSFLNTEDFRIDWELSFDENVNKLEGYLLTKSLETHSTSDAIKKLKISRTRFYDKLKEHQIKAKKT